MFKKVLTLFFGIALFFNGAMAGDLYFMPTEQDRALKALIRTIQNSQSTLDIAIYSFTNREIS